MWIVPIPLQRSSGFPGTVATVSDCAELSQICASSLFVRSKPMPSRTWSKKWRRDSWTSRLCGRIVRPSQTKALLDWWTSSLPVTRARDSVAPVSAKARAILVSYGLGCSEQSLLFNLAGYSSKTSRATSRLDSPQSLPIWKRQVTAQRGEYSARLKLAQATSANASSSWPTVSVNGNNNQHGISPKAGDGLQWKAREWPTPNVPNGGRQPADISPTGMTPDGQKRQVPLEYTAKQWQTPNASNAETRKQVGGTEREALLGIQAKQWPPPRAEHDSGRHRGNADTLHSAVKAETWATPRHSENENRTQTVGPTHGVSHGKILAGQAVTWRTPSTGDDKRGAMLNPDPKAGEHSLTTQISNWPTPSCHDQKGANSAEHCLVTGAGAKHMGQLANFATHGFPAIPPGPATSPPGSASSKLTRRLNPRFVAWLMGVPVEWMNCDWPATPSTPIAPSLPGACSRQGLSGEVSQ